MIAREVLSLGCVFDPASGSPAVVSGSAHVGLAQPGQPQLGQPQLGQPQPVAETTVGMRVRIDEFPLPGAELRAKDVADPGKAAVILRVLNVFPHGSGFRYNLEVTPFVPGQLDLRDYLERVDGTGVDDLPPLPISVSAVLAQERLLPNDLDPATPPSVGGYRDKLVLAIAAWVAGLVALILVGRGKRVEADTHSHERPETLADRLRPLVLGARDGELTDAERARLERLLLAHWRARRELEGSGVAASVAQLRGDQEAGPLFRALERWLHSPEGAKDDVEIGALLEPYQHAVPALVGPDAGGESS